MSTALDFCSEMNVPPFALEDSLALNAENIANLTLSGYHNPYVAAQNTHFALEIS